MRALHDASYRSALVQRIQGLRPDSAAHWGKMTVDQMLWHVNQGMGLALGEVTIEPMRLPIPGRMLKFMIVNLPWGKGARTHPAFVAQRRYEFENERARCLALIDRISTRALDGSWPVHPLFGTMKGSEISRLHAKHLNHHLTQFGV